MFVPLNINLENKRILIVGGGKVALSKAGYFSRYGCSIKIVSPEYSEDIENLNGDNIDIIERKFQNEDLEEVSLVIIATEDKSINSGIAESCREKGILFNDCSNGRSSEFSIPAVVKRGDLNIAVSTNGKSPALSRRIKKQIENTYHEEYEEYLELLGELRKEVLLRESDAQKKRKIIRESLDLSMVELKEYLSKYKGERL